MDQIQEYLQILYGNYLNDIIHIIDSHDNEVDLYFMNKELFAHKHFIGCSVNNCMISDRHCGIVDGKNGQIDIVVDDDESGIYYFHQQLFDTMHYFIGHIFEMGLREKPGDDSDDGDDDEIDDDDSKQDKWNLFDVKFKKQRNRISAIKKDLARFTKKGEEEISKFIVQSLNVTDSDTFLDGFYKYIGDSDDKNEIKALQQYLNDQDYDSEAVQQDICNDDDNQSQSNILLPVQSENFKKAIYKIIQEMKRMLIC